ncbi:flagellar hook-basal body protein [Chengkuizengella axinellae]|uniref:Flagellar basal body rod C-terminal domain-containing protein n=1 Tax=Chengkuizengella axinellae TaxID=3064388 RepID=A0ABT9IZ45_9BACL|nr:flagellar basal body rod C-terminal domain-containing protein [Chengkuizengella sp. 2205SS18-9]MDP5274641.1 flagellar basal body rod C-terminal domain-containing protein [Chengkuizengella sp. 2205SS18-9]
MIKGLYTAAAGMLTQQKRHDTITNNVTNLNTPGYKQAVPISRSFPEIYMSMINQGSSNEIGSFQTGVMIEETVNIFTPGQFIETRLPSDLMINSNLQPVDEDGNPFTDEDGNLIEIQFDASGKGLTPDGIEVYQPQVFFTLWDANEETRYIQNAKLFINDQKQLVTQEGFQFLGQDGQPIILFDDDLSVEQIQIQKNGQLLYNGEEVTDIVGQPIVLQLSQVNNPHHMTREGNGVYVITNEDQASVTVLDELQDQPIQVLQGFAEGSNVDAAQSMVDLTSALRVYEANQQVIKMLDETLSKTVNDIGRVQ